MRYFIKHDDVLQWLHEQDEQPSTLPFFPEDDSLGLVVAQLIAGRVMAEVLTQPSAVRLVVGVGVPLGRMYFHISRNMLYSVCPDLSPESFGG